MNFGFYLIGMVFISFGVVMMLRSDIGLSSWDTLHYSIHRLTGITVGTAIIIVAVLFTIYITIANYKWKYMVMIIPVLIVGGLVDYFNLILFVSFEPSLLITRILSYTLGLFLVPLGGTLLIISTFPAGVFDEFMLTIMRKFKTDNFKKSHQTLLNGDAPETTAKIIMPLIPINTGNTVMGKIHLLSTGFLLPQRSRIVQPNIKVAPTKILILCLIQVS